MGTTGSTDNHSREPVPASESVSGFAIATVIIGVGITLPAFVVGAQLVAALGLRKAAIAMLSGGAFTALLAFLTMRVGAKTRLSTYSIIRCCFGDWGSRFINLLLALTLLGWYGVTATLFGDALQNTIEGVYGVTLSPLLLTALGGALMILTTLFGFRAIEKLSRVAVPLLLAVLVFSVWRVFDGQTLATLMAIPGTSTPALQSIPAAVSVLVGSFIVGVTLTPDLARFLRTPSDAIPAAALSYGLGYPAILLLAGLPVLLNTDGDLIGAMQDIGLGVAALLVMVFATWTTNVNNLYSASLGVARVFPGVPDWLVTTLCGVLGTAMALAGIMNVFIGFLILLGVFVPPIAGIYLVAHYRRSAEWTDAAEPARVVWPAVLAWGLASGWGLLGYVNADFVLSGIPVVDTLLIAMASFATFDRLASESVVVR
ncbi:MAG: cytosine permease [Pseudomonadota bacterium]